MTFLKSPETFYGLFGFAGSGKSTVLSFLGTSAVAANLRICMSAPTHKAVGVLEGMARKHESGFRHFKTIHSLLKMQSVTDLETGVREFKPNLAWWSEAPMAKFDVIIVDECSMINTKIHGYIEDAAQTLGKKIIYVGDPMQLPPVGEEKVNGGKSLSFNMDEFSLLKKVERFGGPIADVVQDIRKNITSGYAYRPAFVTCDEIRRCNGSKRFFDEFMEVHETAQIIAYRNAKVDAANKVIRERLFGKGVPHFVPGERIIAASSGKAWYSQEEFIIADARPAKHMGIDCWVMRFQNSLMGDVYACAPDQQPELTRKLKELRNEAQGESKAKAKALWQDYYDLKDSFGKFRPAYAQTIHASQGSTYPQVFIVERDIDALRYDPLYHGKMLYVAYSRAAKQITVL
jgi:ATP-dependent exoDNAse (exonuclease V) alpha subunit